MKLKVEAYKLTNEMEGYMKRKIWALLMTLIMIATMVPAISFAADAGDSETVTITGTKVWDDNNDKEGKRPEASKIAFKLMQDGRALGEANLDSKDGNVWTYSFDIPKEKIGSKASIEVIEEFESDVYVENEAEHQNATVEFISTDVAKLEKVEPSPSGVDENVVDATGNNIAITKKGNDFIIWTDSPLSKDDEIEIVNIINDKYTSGKDGVSGFGPGSKVFVSGNNVELNGFEFTENSISWKTTSNQSLVWVGNYALETIEKTAWTITNKYVAPTPTPETININVNKVWKDEKAPEDFVRPGSVEVQLMANKEAVGDPVVLNEANGWKHTFEDLAKEDANGVEVAYTVKEVNVPEDYDAKVTGDMEQGFTVTNTYKPEDPTDNPATPPTDEPTTPPTDNPPATTVDNDKAPKTGDDFNPWIFTGIAVAALATAALFTSRRRRA